MGHSPEPGRDDAPPPSPGYPLGTLVIGIYICAVFAVFLGFAAYITRTNWETNLAANQSQIANLDNLVFLVRREETLETRIAEERALVRDIDMAIDAAQVEVAGHETRRLNAAKDYQNAVASGLRHVEMSRTIFSATGWQSVDAVLGNTELGDPGKLNDLFVLARNGAFASDVSQGKITSFQSTFTAIGDRVEVARLNLATVEADLRVASSARDRHLESRSPPLKRIADLEAKLSAVREKVPLDSVDRAQLGSLNGIFGGSFFVGLVSMPTIFLTLLVTIAAGGLGTVVSFSRSYRNQNAEALSASRLFVSLGEGIAAAIAIFLFAGAGMLVLTQGGGADNSVELSPYTVAFIAFLSGFMAENAFERIQKAGREFFSEPADAA